MRLWIAIVAGLSLGQTQDVQPLPPEDPSVRDPAAAALQDAYEQAADDMDGARPPQGYVAQPVDPTQGNYRALTPLLPDGSTPVTSGEVAVQESRTYVAPPVPTVYEQQQASSGEPATSEESQPLSGTGGSGAAGTASTVGGTTAGQSETGAGAAGTAPTSGPARSDAAGVGGTLDTGAAPSAAQGNVASSNTGEVPLDSSRVTVQEPGTATGGAGSAGTATGGAGTAGTTGTTAPATGGSGTGAVAPSGSTSAPSTGTTAPVQGGTSAVTPSGQTTQAPAAQPQTQEAANAELKALRQRIADLEQEMEARDTQATERTQAVQSQVDTHEQRAYEAERARQQRLARIQSGGQWMLAADQALEQGELGVDNALSIADEDFSVVRQSASTYGQGTVVVQSERIRAQIAIARDAASRRDVYAARIALQNAGYMLQLARAASLERSGTSNTLLNP
ncbi:hypothetical protein JYK02_28020 [Corallococcus macrosporus]|uniref:Uncharacterized protein n=1 Tax=Corallococcus macrosporus TaxID=35 RepID=A0ABS3DJ64_9BACT|nr:hypothetical protein [Corallococcus macrosporus]MBN8231364.1 hypothetical protein [Corallococcus macrosporus]